MLVLLIGVTAAMGLLALGVWVCALGQSPLVCMP